MSIFEKMSQTNVCIDFVIDLGYSMESLLPWVKQYIMVLLSEIEQDFPSGETSNRGFNFGFTFFHQKSVECLKFGEAYSDFYTDDFSKVGSVVNLMSVDDTATAYYRHGEEALSIASDKLYSKDEAKRVILLFSDAAAFYKTSRNLTRVMDVVSLFIMEELSDTTRFFQMWDLKHQEASIGFPTSALDKPSFSTFPWSDEMLSAYDTSVGAGMNNLYSFIDSTVAYNMKVWVKISLYNQIKQFVKMTFVDF